MEMPEVLVQYAFLTPPGALSSGKLAHGSSRTRLYLLSQLTKSPLAPMTKQICKAFCHRHTQYLRNPGVAHVPRGFS